MTTEETQLRAKRIERIRRVKRWLRPLPRRTNIHRYPILKFFAEAARKRVYLWSFRVENAVPAIYAGSILGLMPLYGVQLPLALLLALLLRANLPILAGLQMVSNPLTVFPIWYAAYQIGRNFLSVIGVETLRLYRHELRLLLNSFFSGDWGANWERLLSVYGVTCLGAIIMGFFFGLMGSVTYRVVANRTAASYTVLRGKLQEHKSRSTKPGARKDRSPESDAGSNHSTTDESS